MHFRKLWLLYSKLPRADMNLPLGTLCYPARCHSTDGIGIVDQQPDCSMDSTSSLVIDHRVHPVAPREDRLPSRVFRRMQALVGRSEAISGAGEFNICVQSV